MLLAKIVAKSLHVLDEIMPACLLFFEVNLDLVDVFLLLFVLFALVGSDHSVHNCEYRARPVQTHAEGDGLDHAAALEGHLVAGSEAGGRVLAQGTEHVFFVRRWRKRIGVGAIVWFLNFHDFDI